MITDVRGQVRRWVRVIGVAERTLRQTVVESLAVANVEHEFGELARSGSLYHGGTQVIANGIAPVQAIPTTTATLALYNAEESGGFALSIDRLQFLLGSGTPAAGATLFATVSRTRIASAPTAMANGYGVASSSGSSRGSKALWATAMTMPSAGGLTPAWAPVVSTLQLAAANVGQGDGVFEARGRFLVPPGFALGLAIVSGAGTTPLFSVGATWAEVDSDLE